MAPSQQPLDIEVCQPNSSAHRRAVKWLNSIAWAARPGRVDDMALEGAMEAFHRFAQTNDPDFLELSEEMIRQALQG